MIPDMPTTIFIRLQRERYLARQAQLQQSATEVNSSQEADSPEFDDLRCASRDVKKRFAGKVAAGDHNEVAFQPGSFEDCADLSNVKMREHEKDHPPPKPAEQGPLVTMTSTPGRESYYSAKSRYENDGESSPERRS